MKKILLNCLVMFSCLHLTSARIQVALSSVNSKSRLLHFDWLFQTFDIDERFWAAALSQSTIKLLEFLNQVGRAARAIRLVRWKDIHTFTTIIFLYSLYYAKGRPTLYSGPPGKLPVLQMAIPPLNTAVFTETHSANI